MKKNFALLCASFFLIIAEASAAESAKLDLSAPSWSKWRGPNANGVIADTSWNPKAIEKSKPAWSVEVGQGYSSVCVIGDYLFTVGKKTGDEETAVCLEAKKGRVVWSFPYPSAYVAYQGSRMTPVFDNGRLYLLSLTGNAYCLDAATGKKIWNTDIAVKTGAQRPGWGFASSAFIEGDLVFFNVGESGTALNRETGSVVWKSGTETSGYATPVAFTFQDRRCLAVFGSKKLSVVEANSGKPIASTPWVTDYDVNAADPLIIGDKIFIATDYGTGCAMFQLGNKGLTRLWQDENVLPHFASGVYMDGYIYLSGSPVGGGSGPFLCLNVKDGKAAWKERLGAASVIAVGSRLVITTEIGDLIIAEATPKAFTPIAKAQGVVPRLCWTAPVFAGGRIYVRSDGGTLACIDASK